MTVQIIKREFSIRLRNPSTRDNERREIEVELTDIPELIAELLKIQKEAK